MFAESVGDAFKLCWAVLGVALMYSILFGLPLIAIVAITKAIWSIV
jgi:hypothetical protein